MADEIIEGLKNALEHGSTLDEAVNSFVAAGYSPIEVKEAAQALTSGALAMTISAQPLPQTVQPIAPPTAMPLQMPPVMQPISPLQPEKKEAPKWLKIAIVVLLLLIIALGITLLLTYK